MSVRRRLFGPPVPKMPMGLRELMEGLARDVLKNNPENVYEFCARHMQALLEIRDGRAIKPLLTLEEKIERAQKKVRQRAEQRQKEYDKNIDDATNRPTALSATDTTVSGDNSKDSKIENSNVEVQPEEKEVIMIEKQAVENSAGIINETKNEINDKIYDSNNRDHEEVDDNKDIANKGDQEISPVIDSNEKENDKLLIDVKPEVDGEVQVNDINNSIENTKSAENQSVVITSDINDLGNDNVTESLPEDNIKLESDEVIQDKQSNILDTENTHEIQNEDETKIKTEVETITKDNDEVNSTETTVKIDSPSGDIHEDNNANIGLDTEREIPKQTDPVSINNSLNGNGDIRTSPKTETDDNLSKKEADDLSETEISQDDEILTVILGGNEAENENENIEPNGDMVHTNEASPIDITVSERIPEESDQKSEHFIDTERVPESSNDNNKINNSSMDLETAAITIQKVFRSFLFKAKTASYDDPTAVDITMLTEDKEKEENVVQNIKDRRHLVISRMDTVLQTVNEEKSLSLSTDDSSTLSSAATIIQAHVRGFLVRNKLNSNKTISSNSLIDSDAPSIPSLDADSENIKNKTVLNIHIVPEGGHFISRDESILTSMDLSLDISPPSSVNLHPLGYDKSERRKQLKREDAIQSVSPPSNNSGKLSEEHDSVKEVFADESSAGMGKGNLSDKTSVEADNALTKAEEKIRTENDPVNENPASDAVTDEMDVVTPFVEDRSSRESDNTTKLLHSGEFHDIVVPTNVSPTDTSVVREFQNVLVYFILWNN